GSGTVVNYQVMAEDLLPGIRLFCFPPSGLSFPVGTTLVNCAATDAARNRTTCSFAVSVLDQVGSTASFTPVTIRTGKQVPVVLQGAPRGKNPEGLRQLFGWDRFDPSPKIYIKDSAR